MSRFIAALPMYDWPECRAETDASWRKLREALRAHGIAAPERLVRRNGDMPAVPGGIRDAAGDVIAGDPATLPADAFEFDALWRHPRLLLAQTCWGPMEAGLAPHVRLVGQPDYSPYEGGAGECYSSAILVRGEESVPAPADGLAVLPLDRLRGGRLAYNGRDSMSGIVALRRDLEAAGESFALFSDLMETGSHRASAQAVLEGRADACAVDCRTWSLLRRFEARAGELAVVGWTARRKGLPYICSRMLPPDTVETLRAVLADFTRAGRGGRPST